MKEFIIDGHKIPAHKFSAIIIGSGCAGFNAADTLFDLGQTDIAIVTEGINMGTSRNTGSDKQTYYKMAVQSGETDSVDAMAKTLFDGKSVNGDTALAEAAASLRSFMKLVNLGVPFPTNEYGEFAGYRTDHDTGRRATSAGPLTSKYMTEALERQVLSKGITIFDNTMIVKLITDNGCIAGAIGIDKTRLYDENMGFVIFLADNIILATGGPAGIYQNSVYPPSQKGMSGLAIGAGAKCANLQEWQYGIASVDFRWNLSGTYQQVLPRYISIDENGCEREFLPEYFENPADAVNLVFMKGYQWPFDSQKLSGSSMIDMLVYREEIELGRKVYMDFRSEPAVLKNGFEVLSDEAYEYLQKSGALISTPIARLAKMNPKAIELYKSHGIDLYSEPLRITVAAQHNNGGIAVDKNWETNISGLYAAGEVAGTFGVYRPGGSALNSTQAGSLRAAEHIRYGTHEKRADETCALENASILIEKWLKAVNKDNKTLNPAIFEKTKAIAAQMSACGAHIRRLKDLEKMKTDIAKMLENTESLLTEICPADLPGWFRLRDTGVTVQAVVSSMIYAGKYIGSRGGSIILEEDAAHGNTEYDDKVLVYDIHSGCSFEPVRLIPECNNWFETVWNEYNRRILQ